MPSRKGKYLTIRIHPDERLALELLAQDFGVTISELIRQMGRQVEIKHFPRSWQMRVKEQQRD